MATASNFTLIKGDRPVTIGDAPAIGSWQATFDTIGRLDDEPAILMLMVQGLTEAAADVDVIINNVVVGHIFRYNGAPEDRGFANIIQVAGANLVEVQNTLQLNAVPKLNASIGDQYDEFEVRGVVCYFHIDV
jgi:hypothetical protein